MPWFQKLCRNAGLAVHAVTQAGEGSNKQTVKRTVEERKVNENVTVRRTVIEEIEYKQSPPPSAADSR